MAKFDIAFDITNGNEGGWQNDPDDTGNADNGLGTYKGIASKHQPGWKGWAAVRAALVGAGGQPQHGTKAYREYQKTVNSVLAANADLQASVRSFFKTSFWDVNRLDEFASQEVANKVYDSGVNQGTGTAAMLLQKVLGVMPDGSIGPVTIGAANKRNGAELAEAFKQARIAKYKALVTARPEYTKFLSEWVGRC